MVTKSEILKYIMHTPENTNPGIVEGMLDSLGETYNPETIPIGEADVIVKYNNQPIASLSDTGTFALKTAGCRVEQDINVNYTKPSGGRQISLTYKVAPGLTVNAPNSAKPGEIFDLNITGFTTSGPVYINFKRDQYTNLGIITLLGNANDGAMTEKIFIPDAEYNGNPLDSILVNVRMD